MKKIISMFMALALVMATMTIPASAIDVGYYEDGLSKVKSFDTQEEADAWSREHLGIDWTALLEHSKAVVEAAHDDSIDEKPLLLAPTAEEAAAEATKAPAPQETAAPVTPNPVTTPTANIAFTDVPADAWYAEAVNALAEGGLVKGVGNGKFNPLGTVTYAEFVTVLSRLFGLPETISANTGLMDGISPYGSHIVHGNMDTRELPTHWAWPALANFADAIRNKIGGESYTFEPENLDYNVLRADAIAFITMSYERSGQNMTPVNNLTEADIPDWNLIEGIDLGDIVFRGDYTEDGMPIYDNLHVYVIGDKLNFWPAEYVTDNETGNPGYNQSEIDKKAQQAIDNGHPEAAYKPTTNAYPDKVLLAYNLGLAQGIDANHTCGALNTLTRAELCQLLYNAGLTHDGMCKPDNNGVSYLQ